METHFPVSLQQLHNQQQFAERLLEHLAFDNDIFERWRLIGTAQCLTTDIEIANFLIQHYENTWDKAEPVVYCVTCHNPLSLSCDKCRANPTTQPSVSASRHIAAHGGEEIGDACLTDQAFTCKSPARKPASAKKRQKGMKRKAAARSPKHGSENDEDLMGLYIQFAQSECKSDLQGSLESPDGLTCAQKKSTIKSFVCPQCGKIFFKSSDLKKHTRIHTQEKPYACQICPAAFSDPSSFSRHKRVHTGEKPFPCSQCESAFAQSSDLTKHMRIHTRARPLVCQLCDATFSDPSTAARHRRKHERQAEK